MEGGQKGGDRGAIATTRSTVAEHWHPIRLVQHGKGDRDVFLLHFKIQLNYTGDTVGSVPKVFEKAFTIG